MRLETDSELAMVLDGLEESSRIALSRSLQDTRSRCIALRCRSSIVSSPAGHVHQSPAAAAKSTGVTSKLGGLPWLPTGTLWPVDKKGTPMAFIGQVNFAEMPNVVDSCPNKGVLLLFKSVDYRDYLPKDRAGFRIMWFEDLESAPFDCFPPNIPSHSILPEMLLESRVVWSLPEPVSYGEIFGIHLSPEQEWLIANRVRQFNEQNAGKHQLLGVNHPRLDEVKAVCAFAANGVSYSVQRHKDSMYKHLVDASRDWQLLWRIIDDPTGGQGKGATELFVMIRSQDLNDRKLQNSWMVAFPKPL